MAVSYNNLLRLADIGTGTEVGTWGDITDTNITALLAQAVTGVSSIPVTVNDPSDQILTALNGQPDQARSAVLAIYGTLSVTKNFIIPNSVKVYTVFNWTTGGGAIVIKPAGAAQTVTIPTGLSDIVYCDGSNTTSVLAPKLSRYIPVTGGAITGQLVVQDGGMVVMATNAAGSASIYLQAFYNVGPANYSNNCTFYYGNTRGARWITYMTGEAETGGNAGSNFIIASINDAGVYSSSALYINRSTYQTTFAVQPNVAITNAWIGLEHVLCNRNVQSGYADTDTNGYGYLTFPRAFNALWVVLTTPLLGGANTANVHVYPYNHSNTGCNVFAHANGNGIRVGYHWIATGY
jgi:hypothetical protein